MGEENTVEDLKFYSLKSISIASFFGGPVAASILIRRNFLNLNEEKSARASLIIGILTTIFIFILIFSIPEPLLDKIPNSLFPAIYTGIIFLIARKYQGNILQEHKEKDGSFFSAWRAAGIGLIFTLVVMLGIFGFIYATETKYEFDTNLFNNNIEQFLQNEEKALAVFEINDFSDNRALVAEFKNGKSLWEENHRLTAELGAIENLPLHLKNMVEKLQSYTKLRIEHYTLFIKAFSEHTDNYADQIELIGKQIEEVLVELN